MSVRKMPQKDKMELFGNGIVLSGQNPPAASKKSSKKNSEANTSNSLDKGQEEHNQWIASKSKLELQQLAQNLSPLFDKIK